MPLVHHVEQRVGDMKVALVTGASRGIGRSVCQVLAEQGHQVIACARSGLDLENLRQELGINARHSWVQLDFEHPSAVTDLFRLLEASEMMPDIVVNNVGGTLGVTEPLAGLEETMRVLHLNFGVAVDVNQRSIPNMRARGWGRICHISSISSLENQGPPAYCAAKAALNAYVRSVGRFVSRHGISMSAVLPGPVFTAGGYWDSVGYEYRETYIRERVAIGRLGTEREVSEFVGFLCSEKASFVVGSSFVVDGGQGRSFDLPRS